MKQALFFLFSIKDSMQLKTGVVPLDGHLLQEH